MKIKMQGSYYTIEWDGEQWFCYSIEFGKYACYGLGETEIEALQDFQDNAKDFRKYLRKIK